MRLIDDIRLETGTINMAYAPYRERVMALCAKHETLLAASKALRAFLTEGAALKFYVPVEIWKPFTEALE